MTNTSVSELYVMVDCGHLSESVRISGVDLPKVQGKGEYDETLRSQLNNKRKSSTCEKIQWNCVSCDSTESPWLCLACGLIFCGRYVKGHALNHYLEKKHPKHCLAMQCNTYELYCYACDDYVGGDTPAGLILSVQRSLSFFNQSRCADHLYAAGYHMPGDDSLDLGTEEEDEASCTSLCEKRDKQDEDTSSVPEDDVSSPVFPSLNGTIVGGRTLRKRKYDMPSPKKPLLEKSTEVVKIRGLRNLGNTCFMNSIIQALSVTDIFREYLTRLPILEPDDDVIEDTSVHVTYQRYNTRRSASNATETTATAGFLAEELRKVLIRLTSGLSTSSSAISPDDFFQAIWKVTPRFRGYHQHDAHEFLRCALDRLHNELKRCRIPENVDSWLTINCGNSGQSSPTAVSRIFEGSLQSQVVCMTCHTASNKHETFMDLSLDIFDSGNRDQPVTLSECIHRFFEKEELEQKEQYMCGNCMDKRPSTKQLLLRVLPTVLCLHIKRFKWTHNNQGKLDHMVDFPLDGLDISPFMISPPNRPTNSVFDLTSVVVHHGPGVTSGHYTTYGRRNGYWYHFNDSSVKECSEQTVLKQKAYLLFYTRSSLLRS